MPTRVEIVGLPHVEHLMAPYGCWPEGVNPTTFRHEKIVVPQGNVARIEEIPNWLTQFSIYRKIVGNLLVNGETKTFTSEERWDLVCYAVHRTTEGFDTAIAAGRVAVVVHPNLQGKLWITRTPNPEEV